LDGGQGYQRSNRAFLTILNGGHGILDHLEWRTGLSNIKQGILDHLVWRTGLSKIKQGILDHLEWRTGLSKIKHGIPRCTTTKSHLNFT
jgi:hypothetical protein